MRLFCWWFTPVFHITFLKILLLVWLVALLITPRISFGEEPAPSILASGPHIFLHFEHPASYQDAWPSDRRSGLSPHVADFLSSYFARVLPSVIPANSVVVVRFQQIDLAGELEFMQTGVDVRVVRAHTPPYLKFAYQTGESMNSLSAPIVVQLRGDGLHSRFTRRRSPFPYEEELLDRWVRETFGKSVQ